MFYAASLYLFALNTASKIPTNQPVFWPKTNLRNAGEMENIVIGHFHGTLLFADLREVLLRNIKQVQI